MNKNAKDRNKMGHVNLLSDPDTHAISTHRTVCNFQSMKSPMELNGLFSKFF